MVTHWPDMLVDTLPSELAEIEMQTIGDTLGEVLVG